MKKKYEKKEERKDRRDKRENKTSFRGKEREKGSRIRKEKISNYEEEQVKSISDNMYDFTGETEKQSYIYGRNAVAELLKSGQTINKVWISKEARGNDLEKIIRELKEETGYEATEDQLTKLFDVHVALGYSSEVITVFYVDGLEYAGEQNPDEDEFINLKKYKVEDALKLLDDNTITDSKTMLALMYLKIRKGTK